MPKIVDQDQKRAELTAAAYDVIVRDGLASATMRSIAREAGCSTGTLVYYFQNKKDVLLAAQNYSAADVRARMRTDEHDLQGIELLEALVIELLPMDVRRRGHWVVWMAFWDPSMADEALVKEKSRRLTEWHRRLKRALTQCAEQGELRADIDIADEVDRIASLVEGLAVQIVIHKRAISGPRQRRLLHDYLNTLKAGASLLQPIPKVHGVK